MLTNERAAKVFSVTLLVCTYNDLKSNETIECCTHARKHVTYLIKNKLTDYSDVLRSEWFILGNHAGTVLKWRIVYLNSRNQESSSDISTASNIYKLNFCVLGVVRRT